MPEIVKRILAIIFFNCVNETTDDLGPDLESLQQTNVVSPHVMNEVRRLSATSDGEDLVALHAAAQVPNGHTGALAQSFSEGWRQAPEIPVEGSVSVVVALRLPEDGEAELCMCESARVSSASELHRTRTNGRGVWLCEVSRLFV